MNPVPSSTTHFGLPQNSGGLKERMTRIHESFPVLSHVARYLIENDSPLAGKRIGWHCPLTVLTAMAVEELAGVGVLFSLSECNPGATDYVAVKHMRDLGAEVFLGPTAPYKVLESESILLCDSGFALMGQYLENFDRLPARVVGACEVTTRGIEKLRRGATPAVPVIYLNEGLKSTISHFHAVGNGIAKSLAHLLPLIGKVLSHSSITVVGYGRIGVGIAHYLKRAGSRVRVCEIDPARRLLAHFDDFRTCSLEQAMSESDVIVTATGNKELMSESTWSLAKDGLLVANAGYFKEEVGLVALNRLSIESTPLTPMLEAFVLPAPGLQATRRVYLAAGGAQVDVAMVTTSPEPVLFNIVAEILALDYILRGHSELRPGENRLPDIVEKVAATLSLKALGLT